MEKRKSNDLCLHLTRHCTWKNPNTLHQKALGIDMSTQEISGYKINIQKAVTFWYIDEELTERESTTLSHIENQIFTNKFNWVSEESLQWKLLNTNERKHQKLYKGRISLAYWSEKSVLLKCLHYLKQSTYSMQYLWNYQCIHYIFWKSNHKIYMGSQKILNRQRDPEQEKSSWRHNTWFQNVL